MTQIRCLIYREPGTLKFAEKSFHLYSADPIGDRADFTEYLQSKMKGNRKSQHS